MQRQLPRALAEEQAGNPTTVSNTGTELLGFDKYLPQNPKYFLCFPC